MRIGYAGVTIGPEDMQMKTCRQSNASEALLAELIFHNLASLDRQIDYNIRNDIRLFRISSDLIPFRSSSVNRIPWWESFEQTLSGIGTKICANGMRVSMHPGQYTVLNSPDPGVVERAVEDLTYHCRVLDGLGLDKQHKIVLHVGGVYQEKEAAIRRFLVRCQALTEDIRNRLVLENDDRSYHTGDVLAIASRSGLPAIYDNLHDQVNPDPAAEGAKEVIRAFGHTWKKEDGPQKIHYSQQDPEKKAGSHSASIAIDAFLDFGVQLPDRNIDVMLEVKDKNLSAVKCILCTQPEAFYRLVESALREEDNAGSQINAALHVWGYFKKQATAAEQEKFFALVRDVEGGKAKGEVLRKFLWRMTHRYDQPYLKEA